ncbi:MAG: peptidoglycan-binding protein [Ilumatobacteraceae bacterium]
MDLLHPIRRSTMNRFRFPTPHRRTATRIVAAGLALGTPLSGVLTASVAAETAPAANVQGLGIGARGDDVRALQEALIGAGIEIVGGADGVFGPRTLEALNSFRSRSGLPTADTVDIATAVALGLATAPTTGLARGSRGTAVLELQQSLIAAGHTPNGGADGIFGPGTEAALRAFQTAVALPVTGMVDDATAARLLVGSPAAPVTVETAVAPAVDLSSVSGLRYGDWGDRVTTLQQHLMSAGVRIRGGADGLFGRATEPSLRASQSARGLVVPGVADEATVSALAAAIAPVSAPSAAAAPNPFPQLVGLRPGALGDAVKELQQRLLDLGIRVRGGADGVFGPATALAVKDFQATRSLESTGIVDDATATALASQSAPNVAQDAGTTSGTTVGHAVYGEKGERVRSLQQALVDRGITVRGGVDGLFGSATAAAVMSFQRTQSLRVTGIVDAATAEALGLGATAAPADSPVAQAAIEVFPVQGACGFTDTWHAPRSGGRLHLGVDIIAPEGKLVYAVASGTITKVYIDRPGSLAGNGVRLTTEDGTYYFYAHLATIADGIAEGVSVSAGQVVGTIGSTGNSSTPHLHFEIHPQGGASVNPYPIVKAVDSCHITEPLVAAAVAEGDTPADTVTDEGTATDEGTEG